MRFKFDINAIYLDSKHIMMTPAAQMSTAVLWSSCFNKTSGGRKPGVPARAAF